MKPMKLSGMGDAVLENIVWENVKHAGYSNHEMEDFRIPELYDMIEISNTTIPRDVSIKTVIKKLFAKMLVRRG